VAHCAPPTYFATLATATSGVGGVASGARWRCAQNSPATATATNTAPPAIHAGRRRERDVVGGASVGLAEGTGRGTLAVAAAARTLPPGGDFFLRLIRPSFGEHQLRLRAAEIEVGVVLQRHADGLCASFANSSADHSACAGVTMNAAAVAAVTQADFRRISRSPVVCRGAASERGRGESYFTMRCRVAVFTSASVRTGNVVLLVSVGGRRPLNASQF